MRYLADSVIPIDHLNGVSAASEFLDTFVTWPTTVAVADTASRLRRTHRWKAPDALQAAVAFEEGLTPVTRNTRDFKHRDPVPVETPYGI